MTNDGASLDACCGSIFEILGDCLSLAGRRINGLRMKQNFYDVNRSGSINAYTGLHRFFLFRNVF